MNSYSDLFTIVFLGFLFLTLGLKLWLNSRHIRHIQRNRHAVPPEFAEKITLEEHQKAADYTIAKTKYGLILMFVNACVLLGLTIFGGLQWLSLQLLPLLGPGMGYQLLLVIGYSVITGIIDLPDEYYNHFVLEQKFGFNKMTLGLWISDMLKHTLLGAVIGLPLLWVILFLMGKAGSLWWLYAWLFWCGFTLFMQILYPTVVAPLFNKFSPLEDAALRSRIEGLMQRTGFTSGGLFVVDGSLRSAHSNAYFSGIGSRKRVVFYDTLLEQLSHDEIEAVLAHELGHFKRRHTIKFIGLMFGMSLLVFTFSLQPLMSIGSRKHEYEADAFAAEYASASDLISALVKTYQSNASTVTPDPLRSTFYDSHPPAALRIGHLRTLV